MTWITSPSGNVFFLDDPTLVAKMVADGCESSEKDPREAKPTQARKGK